MTGPVPPPPPPPPMGTPPYGQPAPQNNTAQTLGIIGIIAGLLCCPPAGIVLGYLSMNKAKQNGQSTTLGKVAMIVSIVALVLGLLYFVVMVMIGSSTTSP